MDSVGEVGQCAAYPDSRQTVEMVPAYLVWLHDHEEQEDLAYKITKQKINIGKYVFN